MYLFQVPACLIIQMPRFGKSFKMYPRILPSQLLDVTDIIEDCEYICRETSPRNLRRYAILTITFSLFQLPDSAQFVESWLNLNAKIVLVNLVLDWRVLHSVLSA